MTTLEKVEENLINWQEKWVGEEVPGELAMQLAQTVILLEIAKILEKMSKCK